jgi:hypothetical protein
MGREALAIFLSFNESPAWGLNLRGSMRLLILILVLLAIGPTFKACGTIVTGRLRQGFGMGDLPRAALAVLRPRKQQARRSSQAANWGSLALSGAIQVGLQWQ